MRTFSNTLPNYPTTSQYSSLPIAFKDPISLASENLHLQHLIPTLTLYPAQIDLVDLYPNSDVNLYCTPGNISGHFGLLFLWVPYKLSFYLFIAVPLLEALDQRVVMGNGSQWLSLRGLIRAIHLTSSVAELCGLVNFSNQ